MTPSFPSISITEFSIKDIEKCNWFYSDQLYPLFDTISVSCYLNLALSDKIKSSTNYDDIKETSYFDKQNAFFKLKVPIETTYSPQSIFYRNNYPRHHKRRQKIEKHFTLPCSFQRSRGPLSHLPFPVLAIILAVLIILFQSRPLESLAYSKDTFVMEKAQQGLCDHNILADGQQVDICAPKATTRQTFSFAITETGRNLRLIITPCVGVIKWRLLWKSKCGFSYPDDLSSDSRQGYDEWDLDFLNRNINCQHEVTSHGAKPTNSAMEVLKEVPQNWAGFTRSEEEYFNENITPGDFVLHVETDRRRSLSEVVRFKAFFTTARDAKISFPFPSVHQPKAMVSERRIKISWIPSDYGKLLGKKIQYCTALTSESKIQTLCEARMAIGDWEGHRCCGERKHQYGSTQEMSYMLESAERREVNSRYIFQPGVSYSSDVLHVACIGNSTEHYFRDAISDDSEYHASVFIVDKDTGRSNSYPITAVHTPAPENVLRDSVAMHFSISKPGSKNFYFDNRNTGSHLFISAKVCRTYPLQLRITYPNETVSGQLELSNIGQLFKIKYAPRGPYTLTLSSSKRLNGEIVISSKRKKIPYPIFGGKYPYSNMLTSISNRCGIVRLRLKIPQRKQTYFLYITKIQNSAINLAQIHRKAACRRPLFRTKHLQNFHLTGRESYIRRQKEIKDKHRQYIDFRLDNLSLRTKYIAETFVRRATDGLKFKTKYLYSQPLTFTTNC